MHDPPQQMSKKALLADFGSKNFCPSPLRQAKNEATLFMPDLPPIWTEGGPTTPRVLNESWFAQGGERGTQTPAPSFKPRRRVQDPPWNPKKYPAVHAGEADLLDDVLADLSKKKCVKP